MDAYSLVDGQTDISGVTLANYGVSPCPADNEVRDAAISGHALNAHAADGWHPVSLQSMELVGVDGDSMVRLQPPNPDWLNQADCIDMDCDGPKVQSTLRLVVQPLHAQGGEGDRVICIPILKTILSLQSVCLFLSPNLFIFIPLL